MPFVVADSLTMSGLAADLNAKGVTGAIAVVKDGSSWKAVGFVPPAAPAAAPVGDPMALGGTRRTTRRRRR